MLTAQFIKIHPVAFQNAVDKPAKRMVVNRTELSQINMHSFIGIWDECWEIISVYPTYTPQIKPDKTIGAIFLL